MKVEDLIAMVHRFPGATIKIYNADSEQLEPVTGYLFDETEGEIELCSDDTD